LSERRLHWFDRSAAIVQLWGLWVEPTARGKGLGRLLVDRVADGSVMAFFLAKPI
jgi:GNAT superfamily N-acetyltransferase